MHRIETDPTLEPIRNHLRELATAIPSLSEGHLQLQLRVVASYDKASSKMTDPKIMKHKDALHAQLVLLNKLGRKLSIHQDVFQGEPDVAWRAVEELLRSGKIDGGGL